MKHSPINAAVAALHGASITCGVVALIYVLIGALSCTGTVAYADEYAKDAAAVRRAIANYTAAELRKDADADAALTAPDFVHINRDGVETIHGREERRAKHIGVFSRISNVKDHYVINSIEFVPGGAAVTITDDTTYTDMIQGKARSVSEHSVERSFWIKGPSGWLEQRTRTVSTDTTIDGIPQP